MTAVIRQLNLKMQRSRSLHFQKQGLAAIENGAETSDMFALGVREDIARAKYVEEAESNKIVEIRQTIDEQMKALNVAAV